MSHSMSYWECRIGAWFRDEYDIDEYDTPLLGVSYVALSYSGHGGQRGDQEALYQCRIRCRIRLAGNDATDASGARAEQVIEGRVWNAVDDGRAIARQYAGSDSAGRNAACSEAITRSARTTRGRVFGSRSGHGSSRVDWISDEVHSASIGTDGHGPVQGGRSYAAAITEGRVQRSDANAKQSISDSLVGDAPAARGGRE